MLEILITKRVEGKIWKEKNKEEEAGYHLTSLGKRIKSLGDKQDTLRHKTSGASKGNRNSCLFPRSSNILTLWGTIHRRHAVICFGVSPFCTVRVWWLLS